MSDVAWAGQFHPQIVLATATDANPNAQANRGGIWTSSDAGVTWTHIVLPGSCSPGPTNAFGIAYVATDNFYVATDCGLVLNASVGSSNWTQPNNWRLVRSGGLMSVAAQIHSGTNGSPMYIDVCLQGGGSDHSSDSGQTWRGVVSGPECQSSRSITQAPLHPDIVFATSHVADPGGGDVIESDDSGATWTVVKSGSYSGRPLFVATNYAMDHVSTHFDIYFPGEQATCSYTGATPHCPTDPTKWNSIPASSLNHDINGIAMNPIPFTDNCATFMVADFGVYKMGPASVTQPCGGPGAWSIAGNAGAGMDALQMYQMIGSVQYPITGGGVNISGHTSILFGTQDNGLWATYDAGVSKWQCFGGSGYCDPEGAFLQAAPTPQLSTQITLDSLDAGSMEKANLDLTTGSLSAESPWTGVTPPGNNSPPFYVAPNIYVEWASTNNVFSLYLTQDNGVTWIPVGTLPSGFSPFNAIQITATSAGASPAVFEMVQDSSGKQGVALLARFLPPPASPAPFEIQTLGGTNTRGLPSGLQGIWGNCFGQGAWFCAPVYTADPHDYRHLLAADSQHKFVVASHDAGETWLEDIGLTNMITATGASMEDSIGNSQVHVLAFDPGNSSHILVGTDQAGIFASANGGVTWSALPNTARATAITSFFFDDRTNNIFVSTYGRGLWKLTVDWSTVH
jgi:hypothetical protein